jgi:hypothetical protein
MVAIVLPRHIIPPPASAMFCTITQLFTDPDEAKKTMPPPPVAFTEGLKRPLPPVIVNPSSVEAVVSLFSKITTQARLGSVGLSIRMVVSSAPASDWTVIALPRNVMGSETTYSPGATSTVSPSFAASIPACMVSKSWPPPDPMVIVAPLASSIPPSTKAVINPIDINLTP